MLPYEDQLDSSFNSNEKFLDYVIKNNLEQQSDAKFVSNRELLYLLKHHIFTGNNLEITDVIQRPIDNLLEYHKNNINQ